MYFGIFQYVFFFFKPTRVLTNSCVVKLLIIYFWLLVNATTFVFSGHYKICFALHINTILYFSNQ